jgi:hypothetical protein
MTPPPHRREDRPAIDNTGILTERADLRVPGLYSWWVDAAGAADLSRGLQLPVHAGLIYAGLAGATRWPSGNHSTNTL